MIIIELGSLYVHLLPLDALPRRFQIALSRKNGVVDRADRACHLDHVLIREESGFMVYTVDRSTSAPVAERRPVVTGSSYGNEVVIQSGLTDGDEVVVQGQNNVSQGERLDVVEVHQAVEATAEPGEADLSVLPPAP